MNEEFKKLKSKEINTLEELTEQAYILSGQIDAVAYYIFDNGKYFKEEKSIKAIKEMKNLILKKREEYEELIKKIKKTKKDLKCNHEIIVEDPNHIVHCAICNSFIGFENPDIYKNVLIKISISEVWNPNILIYNEISKLIEKWMKTKSLEDLEEDLEELQYKENIKVRRLKK